MLEKTTGKLFKLLFFIIFGEYLMQDKIAQAKMYLQRGDLESYASIIFDLKKQTIVANNIFVTLAHHIHELHSNLVFCSTIGPGDEGEALKKLKESEKILKKIEKLVGEGIDVELSFIKDS